MKPARLEKPSRTVPAKHFAMTIISEFAPNESDILSEFSKLLDFHSESPIGYLNGVAIWQVTQDANELDFATGSTIIFDDQRISYVDRGRRAVLQIKSQDADRILPELAKNALTKSELRLALMLASGLTLQQAAEKDGTSYQTKRSQLKSVFAKTNHAKQHSLVAAIGGEVAAFFERFLLTKNHTKFSWERYRPYLPRDVRAGILFGGDIEGVPYLDFGPTDGKVTYILHPFIFPRIEDADIALAQDANRRIIMPIRPGALGRHSNDAASWSDHVDICIRELAVCFDTFSTKKSDVIALVSSGPVATRFAQCYPAKVKSLSFVSTYFPEAFTDPAHSELWQNAIALLARNNSLGRSTIRYVSSLVSQPARFKQTLLSAYGKSPLDKDAIQKELSDDQRFERLMFAALESDRSITHDLASLAHFNWNDIGHLLCRSIFVHGSADKTHDLQSIRNLSLEATQRDPVFVPNVAQWTEGAPLRLLLKRAFDAQDSN